MRRLENEGIIKGCAAYADQVAVGLPINVLSASRLFARAEAELEAFEAAIAKRTKAQKRLCRVECENDETFPRSRSLNPKCGTTSGRYDQL